MKTFKKKFYQKSIVAFAVILGLCSCNNKIADDAVTQKSYKEVQFVDMNTIHGTAMAVAPIVRKVDMPVSRAEVQDTLSSSISKDELELIESEMKPFKEVGEAVRDELLYEAYDYNMDEKLTIEEKSMLNSMTDEDLTAFGFAISVAYEKETLDKFDLDPGYQASYTSAKLLRCLTSAIGVDDILEILSGGGGSIGAIIDGTKKLITARTAKQIAFALIKRYAGYLGVAYMIYEFGMCMNEN